MSRGWWVALALVAASGVLGVGAWLTRDRWLPAEWSGDGSVREDRGDHDHGEEGDESIVLSEQARKNLGLRMGEAALGEFWTSIAVPATVVEHPGRSHRTSAAPLTGVATRIFVHPGQLVRPGDPIVELELAGDALASTQSDLLQVLRELEVNQAELERVERLVAEGSLPERNKLQLEYDRRRLEAQREGKAQQLLVLGLSAEQVQEVEETRRLIRSFVVRAPEIESEVREGRAATGASAGPGGVKDAPEPDWSYTVETLDVFPGKRVQVGDELCSLAFHGVLYLEGRAFERESGVVSKAMQQSWPVAARFEADGDGDGTLRRADLRILYVDNVVDPVSRTVRFFLALPNDVLMDNPGPEGEVYRTWRFKPGQKALLDVPTKRLEGVFVLPSDAVARDGLDWYVFVADGKRLRRRAVSVVGSSRVAAAIADDGRLFAGETVAMNHAYQLNLALKKARAQGGGGHAGHDHAH
jgi:multidrug efflux pump subunit AcrA (membrane-fusion protein)